ESGIKQSGLQKRWRPSHRNGFSSENLLSSCQSAYAFHKSRPDVSRNCADFIGRRTLSPPKLGGVARSAGVVPKEPPDIALGLYGCALSRLRFARRAMSALLT